MTPKEEKFHNDLMEELQDEWIKNQDLHRNNHSRQFGIRSSQVSALVALLIKKGVLKDK